MSRNDSIMVDQSSARSALNTLIAKYDDMTDIARKEMSEAGVVRQFIDLLLRDVLGYPIDDHNRYKYELHTAAGRPDITLILPNGEKIYIEAKRFGVIKQLEVARHKIQGVYGPDQLELPGMANDRTPEEQQAINYAFANGATWAILTNFERLRLFNARRDWLVLSFESQADYRHEFDQLWQLSYENMAQGSLNALSNQRWTVDIDRQYLSFINDTREKLALDVWHNRKKNPWLFNAEGRPQLSFLREVIQRFLDRLVVVRFAEDHLVMPVGVMRGLQEMARDHPYTFTLMEFLNRLFREFDGRHNSALFALDRVDQAVFSDHLLDALVKKLYEVRYRSMTADILGNTYEEYLGNALYLDGDTLGVRSNLETRKKQGTYYTPTPLVHYLVDTTLGRTLYATHDGTPDGERLPDETPLTLQTIGDLTVLDAACGSGSFLIYAYQVLAGFYQREMERLKAEIEATIERMAAEGASKIDMQIEVAPLRAALVQADDYPRRILEQHLYGVDLDPQASELAAVNLILRALERRDSKKQPLPLILNQNVKTGNGLVGMRPDDARLKDHAASLASLIALRRELREVDHMSTRHGDILAEIAALRDTLYAHISYSQHFTDTDRVNPFHWGIEFPEVFFDAQGQPKDGGGFSIVVGNPPWEIIQSDLREFYAQFDDQIESKYTREKTEQRIAELNAQDPRRKVDYEESTRNIVELAEYLNKSKDYQHQSGKPSTHLLFIERAFVLLGKSGRLGYIIPSGIYTDLGTKPLRELFFEQGRIDSLIGLTNGAEGGYAYFPDVHRSFKFTLLAVAKAPKASKFNAVFRIDPRHVPRPSDFPSWARNSNNFIEMRHDTIKRFAPDSLSVMEFQSARDYQIAETLYGSHPLLGEKCEGVWNVRFSQEINMTSDRNLFFSSPAEGRVPLYEGKMFHQFNPYYGKAQYWVNINETANRVKNKTGEAYQGYRLAVRAIARNTDERSLICATLPMNVFCGNSALVNQIITKSVDTLFAVAILNSMTLDYLLRHKIASNVNMFYLYQLPVPRLTAADARFAPIVMRSAYLTCHDEQGVLHPAFAPLWEEVNASPTPLNPPASQGDVAPSLRSGEGGGRGGERGQMRDELDALVAHLYGLSKDDYAHILKTFPLVFPSTPAGEAKLSDTLRAWDRMKPVS